MAYLVRHRDPTAPWPLTLRTHVRKFPDVPGISPETDQGVPDGWADLPLWKEPRGL